LPILANTTIAAQKNDHFAGSTEVEDFDYKYTKTPNDINQGT